MLKKRQAGGKKMFGKKKEEEPMYSIVATTKAKYFGIAEKIRDGIVIESAYEMDGESDPKTLARHFMKSQLYSNNKRVELSDALIESRAEDPDATRIIRSFEALLPEAKKRALGIMTYKSLIDLLPK
jgi:hypothetical protein